MPILPYGGILPLSAVSPERGLCVYHRVTTQAQAGRKKDGEPDLVEAAWKVHELISAAAPGRVVGEPFYETVHGSVMSPDRRKRLVAASGLALEQDLVVVAFELPRFIRNRDYDHITNFSAFPTYKELICLRDLTGWARLATLVHPGESERERRSKAIKRAGNAGRPSKFKRLGGKAFRLLGVRREQAAINEVAARLKIAPSTLGNWLRAPVPPELINGEKLKWGEISNPIQTFQLMLLMDSNGLRENEPAAI